MHTIKKHPVLSLGLFCIGVWAIALRIGALAASSYWMDESFSISLADAVRHHGYPLVDSGRVVWRSALYHYTLAPVVALFGTGEAAMRFPSVMMGIVSIGVLSTLAWRWFGKTPAILTVALASLSYWQIAWSRQARMYIMLELFFWLTILLTHEALARRTWRWRLAAAASGLATILAHEFGVFVLFLCALLIMFANTNNVRHIFILFFSYIASVLVVVIGAVAFLRWKGFPVPLDYSLHYLQFLVREYADILIFGIAGIFLCVRRSAILAQRALILFAAFFVWLTILSYAFPLLQYRYLFFVTPALLLGTAVSLARLWLICPKIFPQFFRRFTGPALVILFFLASPSMILLPRTEFPLESDPEASPLSYKSITPQPDFRAAYEVMAREPDLHVFTPYPALSRIYRRQDDDGALFFDLTGGLQGGQAREIYTGVPFVRQNDIEERQAKGEHGFVLLDVLSETRLDPEFRRLLSSFPEVFRRRSGEWSEVWIVRY